MTIILFSAIAGIIGTGFGGVISIILGKRSSESTCWILSFAGGVMTSIVCFGLIPEAVDLDGMVTSIFGFVLGIIVIMFLNRLIDSLSLKSEDKRRIHQTHEELYHEERLLSGNANMMRSGILMFIAIALHNIPEGIAIGAGGSHDIQLGYLLALMIALHNIPEGMAIASPLLVGGVKRTRIIFLTALSGAPTLLGGIIGVLLGGISDTALAISLSSAGGAMMYVVFGEIIPQSVVMTKSRVTTLVLLLGFVVGLAISVI